jgi:hypothetical protein
MAPIANPQPCIPELVKKRVNFRFDDPDEKGSHRFPLRVITPYRKGVTKNFRGSAF